jgi:xylulokinase
MAHYLGIDVGTSGTKSLLIDETGRAISEATAEYPVLTPRPGWTEQDPEEWWQAVVATVRQAVHKAGIKPHEVRALGLSGQMHGSVFLDRNDQVIRPALLWNDQRTAAECKEITERAGGRKQLVRLVANPALTGFQAPKILWLRNNEPKAFKRLSKVLLPKDEIRRRLTGDYATEVSDASGTLLLDVVKRQWSSKLLDRLELDPGLLPAVFESEDVTGNLTEKAAAELGLTSECKVVGGAGDCAAGAVGNGVVRSGVLSTSIGTSGVVFVHSDEPQYDRDGRLHTFCHAVRGKWHMMGVSLSSGGSLQWWVDSVLRGLAGVEGEVYTAITGEAEQVPPGSQGLVYLPYLTGERTPHADPMARGAFIGLGLHHSRAAMTRSVMEGIVFALRDSYEIIRGMDVPVKQIRVSGGGSKNPLFRQLQADIFGHKVSSIKVEQGPAFGVALLAAVGDGCFRNIQAACKATIELSDHTTVDRAAARKYEAIYPVFQQLYSHLRDDFHQLASLA